MTTELASNVALHIAQLQGHLCLGHRLYAVVSVVPHDAPLRHELAQTFNKDAAPASSLTVCVCQLYVARHGAVLANPNIVLPALMEPARMEWMLLALSRAWNVLPPGQASSH